MSWGERSCKHFNVEGAKCSPTFETCNTRCPHYEKNEFAKAMDDQILRDINEQSKLLEEAGIRKPATGPLVQKVLAPLKKAILKAQPPRYVPMNRAERRAAKRGK